MKKALNNRPIDKIAHMTDEFINGHFEGTNYGHTNYRHIVVKGLLSRMAGYHVGFTTQGRLIEMGLITPKTLKLTERGRFFLFWSLIYNPANPINSICDNFPIEDVANYLRDNGYSVEKKP